MEETKLTKIEEKLLEDSKLVLEMLDTDGWKLVVKPLLLIKLNAAFPDPSSFKKEEEFVYAAKVSAVFKKVITEVLQLFESHTAQAAFLLKKKEGLKDNFKIGE